MPRPDPEFEALYSETPAKVRANANLPGDLVWVLTKLTNHATYMDRLRKSLEEEHDGFDTTWAWEDFGIPSNWNPTRELILPYLQLSRSEAMKGSEQVVRSFQATRAGTSGVDGSGAAPDLSPRAPPAAPHNQVVVLASAAGHEMKKSSRVKKILGLGE
jgi:hypothetical protein